jgi:ABC-type lipoprotein export system ATPase subunit
MSLAASGIVFAYPGGPRLLEGLALDVAAGASAAIMAPSGEGKTTLLSILGALRRPQAGTVRIDRPATRNGPPRPDISWVFQAMHLVARRTAVDNVALAAMSRGIKRTMAEGLAARAMATFEVAELAARRVATLSGGQAQRVALARAAVSDPLVVLADEPTANLDRATADHVAAVLMCGFPDAALIVTTHDPDVARLADARYRLSGGALRREGP